MTIKLNTTVDSEVFVTTAQAVVANAHAGDYYTLAEFEDKAAFLEKINADFAEEGKPSTFIFSELPPVFEPLDLLSDGDIDAQLWELLAVEDEDDIDVVVAFAAAFGMAEASEDMNAVEVTLELAKSRLYGKYDSDVEYAYADLESSGFMENLPPIIENNLDIDSIAAELKQANNVKVSEIPNGNFYFRDH